MRYRLTLRAPSATINAADTDGRTLTGTVVPYGEAGNTTMGRIIVDAGSVRVPDRLRSVKLTRDHDRNAPVGYAVMAADESDGLRMSFHVAGTEDGDAALTDAAEGLRDGLSVELDNVILEAGHVTAADLVAVSQVSVPAFASAQLAASETPPDPAAATPDPDPAPDDVPPGTDPESSATVRATAVPAGMRPSSSRRMPAGRAVSVFAAAVSSAMRGAVDAGQVNAALADITPANAGTGDLFPRPAWIGELWEPTAPERALVNAIGVSPLTGMTMQGWKWGTKPEVSPYAGNKAEIPTSPATIVPAEAPAHRIAAGWDLDRIYVDFNTGFVEAFLRAATADYTRKSQTYLIDGHAAVTGPPAVPAADGIITDATDLGAQADLLAAVSAVVNFLVGNGARVSFLAMASDLFAGFTALTGSEVPWWLEAQGSVDLSGSASVAGMTIAADPALPPGTVLGGDRSAVSLWETGPINVQAVNLPNGGVDLALFGYWANMVHDSDGLAKATVSAGLPLNAGAE